MVLVGLQRFWQKRHLDFPGHLKVLFDGYQTITGFQGLLQGLNVLDAFFDGDFKIVEINRFGQKVKRSAVHCGTNVLHVTVGGYDHRLHVLFGIGKLTQQGESIHHRHVDIGEDQVDFRVFIQHLKRLFAIVGKKELEIPFADTATEFLTYQ